MGAWVGHHGSGPQPVRRNNRRAGTKLALLWAIIKEGALTTHKGHLDDTPS